jgi:hypothetical protein
MKPRIKRELKILIFILFMGFLLYVDSTSRKSWRYPLELSPANKEIEYRVSLFLLYFGYPATVVIRTFIFLLKKFIKYVS